MSGKYVTVPVVGCFYFFREYIFELIIVFDVIYYSSAAFITTLRALNIIFCRTKQCYYCVDITFERERYSITDNQWRLRFSKVCRTTENKKKNVLLCLQFIRVLFSPAKWSSPTNRSVYELSGFVSVRMRR